MSQSEQVDQLYAALAQAQGVMKNATFNRINPHFKNRYADLAAVIDAIREALSKHGIAVLQTINPYGDGLYLFTTLGHKSGQWISSLYPLPSPSARPQEFGSALTYAKRYSLTSMVCIAADEDDDAELANKAEPKRANPNVNKPEDFAEHEVQYDGDGNPVDNIPHGNPQLKPLRVVDARKEYTALQSELIAMTTLPALRKWANTPQTKDRVQTLPSDWQAHMRDLFEGKKKELTIAEGIESAAPAE
jgi:hypothetical protein